MSYSTETLVKLRGLTAQGRGKANVTVPTVARKYKNKHSYNIRPNKVTVLSGTQFNGNYSFQVPAFNSVVGEMWIEIDLPALTGGTYRKYAPLHVIPTKCWTTVLQLQAPRGIPHPPFSVPRQVPEATASSHVRRYSLGDRRQIRNAATNSLERVAGRRHYGGPQFRRAQRRTLGRLEAEK